MTRNALRLSLSLLLAAFVLAAPAGAQMKVQKSGPDYSKGKSQFPNVLGPYAPVKVGPQTLTNSARLEQLIHEGKLNLSLQDAIALALENNLDISVQRYTPWIADTDVLRAKSGGATRGLAGTGTASVLGAIPSTNFDPVVTSNFNWDRRSTPVNNPFLTGTGVALTALTNQTTQANFQYSQGFHSGTAFAIGLNNSRLSTTSPAQLFNPSITSSLFFSFSQQLLNGFGLLPNTRFIRIAVNSKKIADLTFTNQVMTTVSQVQNLYWDLVFAQEDVDVKKQSLALAEKLYNDNKRQVEIGTLAPIEVVRAEAEVARTRQDLIVSQTFLLQQQTLMKNAITKNPLDPLLLNVDVVPTDTVVQPPQIEVLPLQDAVTEAWEKRPDVQQSRINLQNSGINVKATRNALLPTLTLFGQYGGTGLAGNSQILGTPATVAGNAVVDADGNPVAGLFTPSTSTPVLGVSRAGLTDSWDNMAGFNFPTYTVGFSLSIPIRNRSAQADSTRALLEERQAETVLRRLQNTVVVEVRNAQIALEQNRARVQAAIKARELQEETLDAEQKKYQLGASTIFFVIQAQRDLAQARSTEVQALTALMKAKVDFEQALGRTLEANHIEISGVQRGKVYREMNIPGDMGTPAQAVPAQGKF